MSLHKNLTGNELHGIQAFTYADASARLAATGFTSADIGKVARQLDTNSFWILADPAPVWAEATGTTPSAIHNLIKVGISGAVDFNNIKEAVNYALSQFPSPSNIFTITVYPGTYTEFNPITIPEGIIIGTVSGERDISAIVAPVNPLDDLFVITGGTLVGLELGGVTDPLKALVRMSNGGGATSIVHACSITNCSNGIIIENNATAQISSIQATVLSPNSAINTAIYVTGIGSELILTDSIFKVPDTILPSYIGNPINTCIHIDNGANAEILTSIFDVYANNSNQVCILLDNANSVASILSCAFDDGYTAIKISSSGTNSSVDIQASTIFGFTNNFVIDSSTGKIFKNVGVDNIKRQVVPGASISGISNTQFDNSTDLDGNIHYIFSEGRQPEIGNFLFDKTSSGLKSGSGAVTVFSGLIVDVADGYGWVRRALDKDTLNVSWAATSLLLNPNATNYVFYNASTLLVDSNVSGTNPDNIQLATVITDGTGVRFIHNTSNLVVDSDALLHNYLLSTRKFALNTGLAASPGSTLTKFNVDVGSYYITTTLINFVGAIDATFSYFYNNGAAEVAAQTDVNITQYDNAGTLTTMTDGYYRTDTLYLTSDGRLSLIYGTIQYPDTTSAGLAPVAVAPTFIEPSGFALSNIIVQKNIGINGFVDLRARPGVAGTSGAGPSTGITDHGLLSGLLDDDHPQYLLDNGTRAMSGDLNMGANSIININLVDGIKASAHGSRHNPGQIDAVATAAPVTVTVGAAISAGSAASLARSDHQHGIISAAPVSVSFSNIEGTASTISRSDHVHAHGNLGGGLTHAVAIPDPGGSAGYISSADQLKLNNIAAGATNTPLTNTVPVNVTKSAAAVGVSTEAARQDHKHDISTGIPQTIAEINLEGTAVSLARSDHIHAHGALGGGTDHALVIADPGGSAGFMSPSDKQKLNGIASGATNTPLTNTAPVNVTKSAAVVGVSTEAARQDHKHDISTAVVGTINIGDAAAEGTSTSLARADHVHALTAPSTPVNVDVTAASAGTATTVARSDHKHSVNVGTPVTIGNANSAGTATTLARSDHVHRGTLLQTAFAELTTDTTTTSITFVDLLTSTLTTTGGDLLIQMTASASNTNNNQEIFFRITVDGVAKRGAATVAASGANNIGTAAIVLKVTGLSAASHTIKVQWYVGANTGRIRPVTVPDAEHASLMISEVSV